MPETLILFDVDGTLLHAAGAGRRALEEAFRRVFGVDGIEVLARAVRFGGKTDPMILTEMADAAGVAQEELGRRAPEMHRAYMTALDQELSTPDPRRCVLPGVTALLEKLAEQPGVFLGLVTGNIEAGARAKLAAFGLNRFFPEGGFSDHPDRREIARIARIKVSRRLSIEFSPERVVVVGDTEDDIACARANGFRAIAVESGFVSRESLLAAAPDTLFRDLTDAEAVMAAFGVRP